MQALTQKIVHAITELGITHFISGMALGVDLDFAKIVLSLRDNVYHTITLECDVPCPNQTLKWSSADKLKYESILKRADKINIIEERHSPDCMLKRNRYMVDNSQLVIAVFNGIEHGGTWYTIKYARKTNTAIELIDLCGLK